MQSMLGSRLRTLAGRPVRRFSSIVASVSTATIERAAMAATDKVYVRTMPDGNSLVVTLTLAGRQRNLNRPMDEPLEKAFARLKAGAAPQKGGKKQKKQKKDGAADVLQEPAPELVLELYSDTEATQVINASITSNSTAWQLARVLRVGEQLFIVEYNAPTVDRLVLHPRPMVGCRLLPVADLLFAEQAACQWRWHRCSKGAAAGDWQDTGCSSMCYTPTEQDAGCRLRVECTPGRTTDTGVAALGAPLSAEAGPVEAASPMTAAQLRCPAPLAPMAAPAFRAMSYNILADQYAASDYAQKVLFNYCPTKFLDYEYRKQLVLQELQRYAPDLICLQEVDDKAFHEYLAPQLALDGFSGRFTNKTGRVREGSATFWREGRFRSVAQRDVLLRQCFKQPLPPLHSQFAPMLEASPHLADALQKVTTVAQITLLLPSDSPSSSGPLCLINTHLFYHPFAPHIRSMHTAAILEEAQELLQQAAADPETSAQLGGRAPAVMFCGDLNSDLNDGIPGVIQLLQQGTLDKGYWDWIDGAGFKWGQGEEDGSEAQAQAKTAASSSAPAAAGAAAAAAGSGAAVADGHGFESAEATPSTRVEVTGIDITAPFKLRSADDLKTPYSNYTSGYVALLDYVWYQEERLRVLGCPVPVPERTHLQETFIPSQVFPSDHLAVVYDFEFVQQ